LGNDHFPSFTSRSNDRTVSTKRATLVCRARRSSTESGAGRIARLARSVGPATAALQGGLVLSAERSLRTARQESPVSSPRDVVGYPDAQLPERRLDTVTFIVIID
jgi:hypothetical protein